MMSRCTFAPEGSTTSSLVRRKTGEAKTSLEDRSSTVLGAAEVFAFFLVREDFFAALLRRVLPLGLAMAKLYTKHKPMARRATLQS